MKFATGIFGVDPALIPAIAEKADEVGFESLWCPDHLIPPVDIPATYPYSDTKLPPFTPDTPWPDVFITLAYVAAHTKRLRLGTNVYILPLRSPFVTARAVATLDRLSGGRMMLGIGVGWMRNEFVVAGEAFAGRGARTDEIIHIMRRLWTEETVSHEGKHYSFEPVKMEPKPVQQPVPIHVGGTSDAALRRAAQLGDGWVGVQASLEDAREICRKLMAWRREAGREDEPFEITMAPLAPPTVDTYRRFEEIGVTRVFGGARSGGPPTPESILEGMERFGDEVIAKFQT